MKNKHVKRCSASYVIRAMQIKATRHHCTPVRMAKTPNTDSTYTGENAEQQELSLIAGGTSMLEATEDSLAVSYKMKHTLPIPSRNRIS